MKIKIRKSIPNDVYGIREVKRVTWLKTYPNNEEGITAEDIRMKFEIDKTPESKEKIEERKKKYRDRNTGIWVADTDGKIVGFCIAIKEGEHNRVGAIYVLPTYHRKGLGGQLIEKAFVWLGDRKDILINVARYNKQAINFYNKFGFLETGKEGTLDSAAKLPSGKVIPEIELVKKCSRK
jgi:ribosomal protein S18 acetylase RimI-like enzyme